MVKRKLDVLSRGSYASQSAIEGLLEEVRRNGLLEISSRRTLSRDLAAEVSRETPYGKFVVDMTLPLREGGDHHRRAEPVGCVASCVCREQVVGPMHEAGLRHTRMHSYIAMGRRVLRR